MKKYTILLLTCFLITLQTFSQTSITFNAPLVSFNALPGITGQSFTATQDGLITYIQIVPMFTTASVLSIYSGEGFGGPLLHTQNVNLTDSYDDVNSVYTFQTITIDASVAITNGSVYTFSFSNNSLPNATNLYGGGQIYLPNAFNGDTPFSILQGAAPADLTFVPASGTWNSSSNWSPAQVPTSIDNITIANGKSCTLGISGAVANNLTIDSGGTLKVNPTASLTVSGTLTQNGTMQIKSDFGNFGSVIAGTAGGSYEYQRYLTKDQWHLFSAPLQSQTMASFIDSHGTSMTQSGDLYSLASYNNQGTAGVDLWSNYTISGANPPPASPFVAGKGYEILMSSNGVVIFTGSAIGGSPSVTLTENTSAWNLIGNPFLSSIFGNVGADATNNFLTVNSSQLDQSFVSMYVWNPTNGSYDIVNNGSGARSLAVAQAFFVKAKSGGGTVNFTTPMRTHQSANNFQKAQTTGIPTIQLLINDQNSNTSSTEIKYMGNGTLGLDPGYDAGRFDGVGTGFSLYTHLVQDNGVDFSLQVVSDADYDTAVIPVGLDADSGSQITIKALATDLPVGKKVFLEDRQLSTVTEINNTDKFYTTTLSTASTGIGRFFVHTQDNASTLGTDDFIASKFILLASPQTNNIKLFGYVLQQGSLAIYDSLGRLIHTTSLQTGASQEINIPTMATGVYFVKVKVDSKSFSKKIVWY